LPTFIELSKRLSEARFRRTVLLHLVEHLDESFRPSAGHPPEKMLLTDDKLAVPSEIFDSVVEKTLLAEIKKLDDEISSIAGSELAPQAQPAPKEEATPTPQDPPPEPVKMQTPPAVDETPPVPSQASPRRRRAERA
jgi:outer membrane biosynthesis protein TonB